MLQTIRVGNISAENFSPQTILTALAGSIPEDYGVVNEGSVDSLVSLGAQTLVLRPQCVVLGCGRLAQLFFLAVSPEMKLPFSLPCAPRQSCASTASRAPRRRRTTTFKP